MTGTKALAIAAIWLLFAIVTCTAIYFGSGGLAVAVLAFMGLFVSDATGRIAKTGCEKASVQAGTNTPDTSDERKSNEPAPRQPAATSAAPTRGSIAAIVGIWLIAGIVTCTAIVYHCFDEPGIYALGIGLLLYFTTKLLIVHGREEKTSPTS